jgi:DNA mismatch repair ATPase MutL
LPGAAAASPFRFAELTLLGQLHATYLALETKGSLLLIDQHAAHERGLY